MKQITQYITEKANFLVKKHLSKLNTLDDDTLFKIINCDIKPEIIESCSKVNFEFKLGKQKYPACTGLIFYQNDFEIDPDYILFIFSGSDDSGRILEAIRDYINLDKKHSYNFDWTNAVQKEYIECVTGTKQIHRCIFRLVSKDEYSDLNITKRW